LKKIGVPQEIQTNYILYINKKQGRDCMYPFLQLEPQNL